MAGLQENEKINYSKLYSKREKNVSINNSNETINFLLLGILIILAINLGVNFLAMKKGKAN